MHFNFYDGTAFRSVAHTKVQYIEVSCHDWIPFLLMIHYFNFIIADEEMMDASAVYQLGLMHFPSSTDFLQMIRRTEIILEKQ